MNTHLKRFIQGCIPVGIFLGVIGSVFLLIEYPWYAVPIAAGAFIYFLGWSMEL